MMTRTGRRFSILFAAIAALAKTGPAAARRAFHRSARVLAAVALLALFGALALPTTAEAQAQTCTLNPGDIWCGVVTPVSYLVNGVQFGHGFVDGTPDTGALSDEEFGVVTDGVTNSYTIRVVFVGVGGNTGSLSFRLTSALTAAERAKLDLHVEGRSDPLAFSVASESASNAYVWTGTGLDWSSGDPVTLRLRAVPTSCTLNPGDIWCGVVTPALFTTAGVEFAYGFSDAASVGDLPDNMFSVVTNGVTTPYTIDVVLAGLGINADTLFFSLTSALTAADEAKLLLYVDGRSDPLAFNDTTLPVNTAHTYQWDGTGLDWSSEDYVTLRLRGETVVPSLSVWDAAASAGSNMAFTVTLSDPIAEEVTATWTASIEFGDTAVAADLGSPTTGMVTFAPNATTARFVLLLGQIRRPGDHTFRVTLSGVSANAQLVSNWIATGTIIGRPTSCTLNSGDIWCGVVTVGTKAQLNGKTLGHGFHQTWRTDGVGALPDRRFVYGANSYRIDEVTVGAGGGDIPAGFLFFSLNRAFPAADEVRLALYVGSDRFLLSKAHGPDHNTPTYHWRGTGLDWSSTYSVTLRLRADLPPAPSAVTATTPPDTGGLLEVGWSALASSLAITGYEVNYWKAADAENGPFRTARTESTETSMLLPSLAANTEYKVRVRARNAIGTGAWSAVATARIGAVLPGKPIVSLAVVDGTGADTDTIVAGGTFRYRINVTNLRNHHDSSPRGTTGWGTLGVRGGVAIDYRLEHGTAGGHLLCDGLTLFLKDWTRTAYTAGYWEFESPVINHVAATIGPLRLRMGFACRYQPAGPVTTVTNTSDHYTLGSPAEACLSIENSLGTIMHACPADSASAGVAAALTAAFEGLPEAHDGETAFTFRIAFSEAVSVTPEAMRTRVLTVTGGAVTGAARVNREPGVWAITVTPDTREALSISLPPAADCAADGAVCTADGRALSIGAAHLVSGPPDYARESNTEATGTPTISGTPQVGETLTADTSGIADDDGLKNVSFSYQWLADDTAIQGATGSAYTLIEADEGKTVKVEVSFADDTGNGETLTSTATEAVAAAPQPNNPATGAPTISGTAQVGETLTADTSGIADADGLENVTFSYQWLADAADIPGATEFTYTLSEAVEGTAISVQVSFTDDAGNEESLTSEDAAAWSAIMTVEWVYQGYGYYSTDTKKAGSLSPASFKVDGTTYTVKMVETQGWWMYIGVDRELPFGFVLELDGTGFASSDASFRSYSYGNIYRWEGTGLSLRDGDTVEVRLLRAFEDETAVNSAATGAPIISGTVQVGETLTADTSGIADTDGLTSVSYTYQWIADGADIAGATGSTYILVDADTGKSIKIRVSFTDDGSNEESLTSRATDAVEAAEPTEPPTQPTGLSGEASHDAITLTWDDPDDDTITGYVILRRNRDIDAEGEFTELVADTETAATTYTDHSVEAETPYTYRIKAINGAGPSERSRWFHIDTPAAPSSETTPEPANTPATGTPTISGTVQVGEMLTVDRSGVADEDGLDNAAFTYQWLADDDAIAGATDSTYTPADADEGKAIAVQVSFTDDAGNDETLTSAATDAVAAPEPPASPTGLSATASHDSVTLTWDDPGDDTITGYVILRRNRDIHAEGEFTNLVEDTGAAATTYTDDSVAAETPYTYRVKAINEHGGVSERSRWFHIDTPAAPTPEPTPESPAEPPASPTGLAADVSHDSVTLTWDDPGDDSITGYVILRRDSAIHEEGTFETVESDTGSAETTYTDDSAQPERKYVYRIKAINKHGLSAISSWVRAYTPAAPVPAAPTGLSASASHDSVTLTWDDPGDDTITGYVILRRNRDIHAEGEFTTLVEDTGAAATTYTDDTVEPETPYTYRIKAINEHGGVSERSRWFHIDTPAAPLLATPTGVGSAVSSDTVMLIWADPQDDSITGYRILRRDGDAQAGGEFTTIESDTGSAATTYTDGTVEPDLVYVYRVLAISPHGVSEPSRDVEVSTAAPKEPLLSQPAQVTRVFHHVSEPTGEDFPADDTTTGFAPWGSTVTGNIDDPSDVDWFWLDAQAGLLYQIDLGPEPVMDPAADPELVGIYDASGALLPRTSNDNVSVSNLDSRVFFSSSEDGAYYVAVGSADSGAYRLSVSLISFPRTDSVSEEMGEDFPETEDTKGFILVGGTVTGNIDGIDIDWFQTQLEAGHRYQIDVEGVDTSQGTLTDPVLYTVRGYLVGAPVATVDIANTSDDDSGSGKNARSTFTMPDGYFEAPVYISVTSEENATGTYRMRLREVVPLGGDGEPIEARLEPGDSVSGTFDPFTWYYFALDGLTSGRYTVSFSKGAIEAIYAPGNLITDQPHGAARYTFDVRSTGTPQTRYVWLVVWGDAGSYTVSLDETMLDLVVGGSSAAGEIPKTTDLIVAPGGPWGTSMQFFPVELEAGVVYQVDIKGVDTGDGTMDYPMLANIAAPDGSYVGGTTHLFVQGGGEGRNVRYVFTADQDGMYFLKAGGALWKVYDVMDNYIGTRYRAGTFTVSIQETEEAPSCTLNRGDLWCGVVTVGHGGGNNGYDTENVNIGDLSDTDVDVGPNSYTIIGIFVDGETSVIPGTLSIVFHPNTRPTAADRDTLVLQVGGRSDTFAFSDAFVVAGRSVSWTSAGLDWSEEEYVIVRLREK